MMVVDASVVVELLLRGEQSGRAWQHFLRPGESWHAPSLIDLEVLQTLRRAQLHGDLTAHRADEAVADLRDLHLLRYPPPPFLDRIWELRHSVNTYDAAYVALAEELDCALLTLDARLAKSHGHAAKVELLART
jgi:predicted nucleic acid-binding protein